MHAYTPAEIHAEAHATRTAELAAEAAAWHLARETAPAAPALRNLLGEALVSAGIRLMQPAHIHALIQRAA
ncbi:hypothetical protein OHB36_12095 [Streptomyces sp. NBC_00320]|uniref:hypothetical protein n=1 Tax=Streptomyces sp. NBC_00320 TaxID=2975711 RepID=UPI002252BDF9|nr:hypothetical protein [Streptomyces sp. NBC_00320]MCX5147508.1 hypothetical protein [Streptomyces sp. NBC_00320]